MTEGRAGMPKMRVDTTDAGCLHINDRRSQVSHVCTTLCSLTPSSLEGEGLPRIPDRVEDRL